MASGPWGIPTVLTGSEGEYSSTAQNWSPYVQSNLLVAEEGKPEECLTVLARH